MTTPIGITLSLDGVQKFEADGRRAAGTVDSIGVSAKQTAAALRGVPAQFTDIITSLQGGQAPLTVLLQQGGQLKDMFGGVGAAAKGLGGYVAGLVSPFSMAAAAAVGVAVAYKQGSAEADSYRTALITTGNAAGATAAQMQQMAGRIGAIVGTQGAAADALAQMAGSGRVAAQNFEYFGEVALKTEKSIGTAVSETVKQFAELGKSPVEASRKLNEETNYLTAAIYEQIKALKDQGRDADAAALAQKTYADALNGRSAQMTQNLGVIEKAWQGITGAAKGAWDAMLNVGRQDTLATKMDDVRAKIAQAQGQDKNRRFSLPWDTPLAELQQQLSYLSEEERMLRRGAEAQAARTQAEKAAIDAADALRKTQEKGLTKQQQMNKALEEYRKQQDELRATNPTSALLSPGAIAVGERVIRDQFKETGSRSGAQANAYAAEQEAAKVWAKTLKDVEKGIADVEEKTLGLNKAQAALLEYISSPAYATNSEEMRQAALVRLYAWDAAIKNADGIKAEKAAMEQASKAMATWFDARAKDASALTSQVQARREEVAAMGLSADAVARLSAAKYEQAAAEQEAYASALKSAKLYAGEYAQAYDAAAQDALDQAKRLRELGALDLAKGQKQAALDAEAEWKRTSDSINQSLTDALMRGFESGKDMARNLRDTVVSMFKTMVLRPVVSAIVSPISGALLGGLGLAGSAAASQGQGISGVSTAISGASLLGRLGAFGGGMSAGFGGLMGSLGLSATGSTLGGAMSAGSIAMGSGNILGGLGTFAGALGPIALGIGLLSSAFSRKLKDQGIQGTLGGEAGFEGQQYRFYKGGLFRSDKTTYSAIDPELARMLAGGFSAVQNQVTDFAEALSLPTDRIKGFTTDIKVSFKGLDEAGIQKALQDALATGSNELAQQVLGTLTTTTREVTETLAGGMGDWGDGTMQTVTRTIEETTYAASEFARDGEQAIDTLTRLATSLYTVNDIWKNLGYTVYEASLAGADAASKMADAFGGLEAMAQATGAYFQNFYSAEEQRAAVERQLNEALGKLNLQLPDIDATDARAQYRALAEAQDRNTEAGREAYVVLLKLSGAFASVTAESETAAAAAARLAGEQRKSEEAATRAAEEAARRAEEIARERYGLETQLMQLLGDTAGLRKREIEALDASNRALQNHIYAIEDARAAYEKSITAAQSAYGVLESSVGRDRSALQSALDAEREAITARYKLQQDGHAAQLSAAQSAADKMRGIASMLSGALGRMVVESPALDRARLQSARGVIGAAAASSNVMAPGLEAALSVVTSDVRKMYGRWEDFAFDRGVTAGQTAALSSAAQSQLSGYESIVNALKAQDDVAKLLADAELAAAQERFEIESKKLDAQLEQGKSMLDRLLGIEEGTLSSVEALARLTDAVNASNVAMQAQRAAEAAARAAAASGVAGGAGPGPIPTNMERALWAAQESAIYEQLKDANFLGSLGVDAKGLAAAVADAALVAANDTGRSESTLLSDALGRIVGRDGAYVATRAVTALRDSESLFFDNDAINFSGSGYHDAEKMRELERLLGVHGSHAGGLAYVPFDGYRAELHKGERVLTEREAQAYTPPSVVASMLRSGGASDAELLAELRAMRQRLEAIEAAANATAGAAVGTDRKLARVVDNDALRTREKP